MDDDLFELWLQSGTKLSLQEWKANRDQAHETMAQLAERVKCHTEALRRTFLEAETKAKSHRAYDAGIELAGNGPVSDYADQEALAIAHVSPGTYATCLSQGLFRLGASPTSIVTVDGLPKDA